MRIKKISGICLVCKKKFFCNSKKQKHCSHTCCDVTRKKRILKNCKICNKEFEVIPFYDYVEWCSTLCKKIIKFGSEYITAGQKQCPWCHKKFQTDYKGRRRKYCSRNCASADGWNLGLTKETDPRLKLVGTKGQATRKQKIENGDHEIYSHVYSHGKKSKFKSNKAQQICHCRSSWEEIYCKWLESNNEVLTFKFEPLIIRYEIDHNQHYYLPDFLVTYTNGKRELIEIKPKRLLKDPVNLAKFKAAKDYCKKNNIKFKVLSTLNFDFLQRKSHPSKTGT